MYKIESNIPIPQDGRGRAPIYPYKHLKRGDSFLVTLPSKFKSAQAGAHKFGKGHSMKFKTRAVDGGLRIWRIT